MDWVTFIFEILFLASYYCVVFPLYYAYSLLRLVVIPLVALGQVPLYIVLLPCRIILKFEALLKYLSAAVLIGIILGVSLHLLTTGVVELANGLFESWWTKPVKSDNEPANLSDLGPSSDEYVPKRGPLAGRPRKGMFSTILEEEEEGDSPDISEA